MADAATMDPLSDLTQDERKLFDFYIGVAGEFEKSPGMAQAREVNTGQVISPSVLSIKMGKRNEYAGRVENINALLQATKY